MVPGIVLFGLFALLPAAAVLPLSFTNISGVPNVPWHFVGLANYIRFFSGGQAADNLATLQRTVVFCVVVTVVQTIAALGIAVLLNSRLRGRSFYRAAVFLPSFLGVTVIGLIWSLVFNVEGGPAETLLQAFGGTSAFLGDSDIAFWLVVGIQMWTGVGYAVVIFLAGLQTVPRDLLEAAVIDGANRWARFRRVTLRLLAPAVTANVVIAIIGSLQSYQLIYVLTGGQFDTKVLAMQVLQDGFGAGSGSSQRPLEQGYASAASILQFVLIAAIALIALSVLRRREVDQ
jgi:raffinose/stachyose/melibiose transport system permease protein